MGASPLLFIVAGQYGRRHHKMGYFAHPVVTIRCFGWQVFFKAVAPWQGRTFLSLLQSASFSRAATSNVPTILERCIGLELRAKRIYLVLAEALDDQGLMGPFFAGLAEQEQYHADLLELCRAAAIRSGWKANLFNPWQDYLPRLEQQMDAAEAAVREIDSIDAALQLVIQVESSEINAVFKAALGHGCGLVKKLRPFQENNGGSCPTLWNGFPTVTPIDAADKRTAGKVSEVRSEPR